MSKFFRYIMLINLAVLIGCSSVTPPIQLWTTTPIASPEKTATISSPTPSLPLPTPVVSTLPTTSSVGQCIGSQQNLPTNIDGEFVLSGNYALLVHGIQLHQSPSYILTPATGGKLPIPLKSEDEHIDFSVSPNKKWLAYYVPKTGRNGQLILIGNDGKTQKTYPTVGWWGVMGWIDDDRLLISKLAAENPFTSFVFDPFKGNLEKELPPNYPGIYTGGPSMDSWGVYGLPETVYNSDLSMVVYPKDPNNIILWDIKAKKEIAQIKDYGPYSKAPLWLGNGKQFIINISIVEESENTYREEIMSVSTDGSINRLTHMVDQYGSADIDEYSESADGRFIAFWFRRVVPLSGIFQLAIYDTQTEKTKILCVNSGTYLHAPVWSPSSHQLLAAGFLENVGNLLEDADKYNYGTVFVDVDNESLSLVEKDVIPVGWMVNP